MEPQTSEPDGDRTRPARLHVLVADDEPMIRKTLHRVLERRGHRVDEAEGAREVLARMGEAEYDAVLLDANMPGNGRTVVRHLIDDGFAGRIILMTGALAEGLASEFPDGVHRVQKPFDFDSMIRLVEGGDESTT